MKVNSEEVDFGRFYFGKKGALGGKTKRYELEFGKERKEPGRRPRIGGKKRLQKSVVGELIYIGVLIRSK